MENLWSISTTLRNPNRIVGFLKTASELEGEEWNNGTQCKFQILLIKNRFFLDSGNTQVFNKLNEEQIAILKDKSIEMSFEQAKDIFLAKQYNDPPMRGRQSMSPLKKLGLVSYRGNGSILHVTDLGHKLINQEIELEDFVLDSLLKFQFPEPGARGYSNWNTKPFLNTLRLIKKVNELCKEKGLKEKGISIDEFGIFALSLKSYEIVDKVAEEVLKFREEYESLDRNQQAEFKENFIETYLSDFKNPKENVKEYTDNVVRYLRLTKYIYIRGKYSHVYIDLEPRRMIEINSILETDDGSAQEFTVDSWYDYIGNYRSYELPFETVDKLTQILEDIESEIRELSAKLIGEQITIGSEQIIKPIPTNKEELIKLISYRRDYRTYLRNVEIKLDYHNDVSKIDETILNLNNLLNHDYSGFVNKPSVELEKWVSVGLNIINDSELIKPNYPVGDDNEPTSTAPANVPDIECNYADFNAICEVTLLKNRDQWFNEGQPVMRHLRDFEDEHIELPNYALFIAPSLHRDTLNTFHISVKHDYEGRPQKIIPMTIRQFINILETIKNMVQSNKSFKHQDLQKLFDDCVDYTKYSDSIEWETYIDNTLSEWISALTD